MTGGVARVGTAVGISCDTASDGVARSVGADGVVPVAANFVNAVTLERVKAISATAGAVSKNAVRGWAIEAPKREPSVAAL